MERLTSRLRNPIPNVSMNKYTGLLQSIRDKPIEPTGHLVSGRAYYAFNNVGMYLLDHSWTPYGGISLSCMIPLSDPELVVRVQRLPRTIQQQCNTLSMFINPTFYLTIPGQSRLLAKRIFMFMTLLWTYSYHTVIRAGHLLSHSLMAPYGLD